MPRRHGGPVMRGGKRLAPPPPLSEIRSRAAAGLCQLPTELARLGSMAYPVAISDTLRGLADECDRRIMMARKE